MDGLKPGIYKMECKMNETRIAIVDIQDVAELMRAMLIKRPERPTVFVYAPTVNDSCWYVTVETAYGKQNLSDDIMVEYIDLCTQIQETWNEEHNVNPPSSPDDKPSDPNHASI